MRSKRPRIDQTQALGLIFNELSLALGEYYSSRELLKAAAALLDLADQNYGIDRDERYRHYSNYYSHDLVDAMRDTLWRIAAFEQRADLLGDERHAMSARSKWRLRNFLKLW